MIMYSSYSKCNIHLFLYTWHVNTDLILKENSAK